jgi:sialate O-acetylesterase
MSYRSRVVFISVLALVAAPLTGLADVSVSGLFGDHMVMQRDVKLPIWGMAKPGEQVTVSLGERKASATADAAGRWQVKLDPLPAGGPFVMTLAGDNRITIEDVMVGEVWVCSGQSNMAMTVQRALNADKEMAAADYPRIRLLKVARGMADVPGPFPGKVWAVCSPETVPEFSAAGYFFGRELYKSLNVPIGLIDSAVGGTPAEAWTPKSVLEADPALKSVFERWEALFAEADAAAKKQAENAGVKTKKKSGKPVPTRAQLRQRNSRPGVLYNAMIHPLMPYAVRGAIWYQGESNAKHAYEYRKLFPTMIQAWRKAWGQKDFPFLFVQIAGYEHGGAVPYADSWAELREAQLMTLSLPQTAMAVITDVSEAKNIHPLNKQEVGRRLSLAARALVHGEKIEYSGPLYKSMKIEGDKIRLRFRHAKGGLKARGEGTQGLWYCRCRSEVC